MSIYSFVEIWIFISLWKKCSVKFIQLKKKIVLGYYLAKNDAGTGRDKKIKLLNFPHGRKAPTWNPSGLFSAKHNFHLFQSTLKQT